MDIYAANKQINRSYDYEDASTKRHSAISKRYIGDYTGIVSRKVKTNQPLFSNLAATAETFDCT